MDWTPCSECGAEFLPHALRKGLCIDCYSKDRVRHETFRRIFGTNEQLIEMAETEYKPNPNNRAAVAAATAFNPETDNLYLHGSTGTGKTHLACRLVGKFMASNSCAYINVIEWIQSLWGRGSETQGEVAKLLSVPILIVDEIAVESRSEFTVSSLYLLMNGRWARKRNGMIITSNLDLEALQNRLGDDRITSRIGGLCRDNIIELGGSDKRQEY